MHNPFDQMDFHLIDKNTFSSRPFLNSALSRFALCASLRLHPPLSPAGRGGLHRPRDRGKAFRLTLFLNCISKLEVNSVSKTNLETAFSHLRKSSCTQLSIGSVLNFSKEFAKRLPPISGEAVRRSLTDEGVQAVLQTQTKYRQAATRLR